MTLDTGVLLSLLTADPATRESQVSKLLAQQLGGAGAGPSLEAILGAAGSTPQPAATSDSPTAALYREAQLLDDEVRRLVAIVADLAGALGACPRCVGTDDACHVCAGAGAAGSSEPDRELFAALVAPAVVRVVDEEGAFDTS